jgi:type II secretory pathway pseudopilin PulG
MIPYPKKHRSQKSRGLTLMETVIAVGVIAFAVPIILATSNNSTKIRRDAEAETRATWIVTDVQRMLTESWRNIPHEALNPAPAFPDFASQQAPIVFYYDVDGRFLQVGAASDLETGTKFPRAVYLVTLYGIGQDPQNFLPVQPKQLSLVTIEIQQPAAAPQGKRQISSFNVMIPRQTPP